MNEVWILTVDKTDKKRAFLDETQGLVALHEHCDIRGVDQYDPYTEFDTAEYMGEIIAFYVYYDGEFVGQLEKVIVE